MRTRDAGGSVAERCRACAAPLTARGPGGVRDCAACGTRNKPCPSEAALAAMYAEAWGEERSTHAQLTQLATMATGAALAGELLALWPGPWPRLRVLDHGAGRGSFARALADRGAEAWAYEPHHRPEPPLEGVRWCQTPGELPAGDVFDRIALVEVIEHLVDPAAALTELSARLRPGGELLVTTPNARGANARLRRDAWREFTNPTHLTLFTARGLEALAARCGLPWCRPLPGFVSYGHRLPRRAALRALHALGLDGGLRVLLRKG